MLVVKVELWPFGETTVSEDHGDELARAIIGNMGREGGSTPFSGNYHAIFKAQERISQGNYPPFYPNEDRVEVVREGFVKRFPRLELGAWDLLATALNAAGVKPV